jgi:pimeloyl-ACP methyl ester carboxylesterase
MQASQIEEYLAVFSEPYALTAALNWYRQMGESLAGSSELSPEIDTPTLFIWGRNDPTAGQAAVDGQEKYMRGPYRRLDLDGEHWLVTNHSAEITQALLQHLGSN